MEKVKENFAKHLIIVPVSIFILLSIWGGFILFQAVDPDSKNAQLWSATYQVIAWFGAIYGLFFASLWGGWKSLIGRANLAFACGLLAQSFGQIVFSYYTFKGVEALYPSVADIGFFGSIPLYIYGVLLLAKASGVHSSLKSISNKIQVILIPLCILVLSYFMFLKDYQFDWTAPLTIFLDFGYPLGQAIYISVAITAYLLSRNFLGGIMKKPIIFFIVALVIQYIADYIFLYQINRDLYVGGYIIMIDFLYMIAYLAMAISLMKLSSVFYRIQKS